MKNRFDIQLEHLNTELITMGALCEEAISAALKGLLEQDTSMMQKAFEADAEIDRKEREIENLCMRLLLHNQPVARDLRTISSALKMISDMERIGDQASDIAEITKTLGKTPLPENIPFSQMAQAAIKMVTDSVDSFVRKDLTLARSVMAYDDTVDRLFLEIKNKLIALVAERRDTGEHSLDLLMIAKYLERIGDHAVNVAEWVEYSLTGQHHLGEI